MITSTTGVNRNLNNLFSNHGSGTYQNQDFKGFLSTEARRLAEFKNEHPGSNLSVYKNANDEAAGLTKSSKAEMEALIASMQDGFNEIVLQKAKSMNFFDELKEAEEARENATENTGGEESSQPVEQASQAAGTESASGQGASAGN